MASRRTRTGLLGLCKLRRRLEPSGVPWHGPGLPSRLRGVAMEAMKRGISWWVAVAMPGKPFRVIAGFGDKTLAERCLANELQHGNTAELWPAGKAPMPNWPAWEPPERYCPSGKDKCNRE